MIISTKGVSVTAARQLIDTICGDHELPLFVLHDFDVAGFLILGTLQRDTRRYQFSKALEVIDLGLRLGDIAGLEREPAAATKIKVPKDLKTRVRAILDRPTICAGTTQSGSCSMQRGSIMCGQRSKRPKRNPVTSRIATTRARRERSPHLGALGGRAAAPRQRSATAVAAGGAPGAHHLHARPSRTARP